MNRKLYSVLKGIYASLLACVRDKYSDIIFIVVEFPLVKNKQGCPLRPLMLSFFVSELAMEVPRNGKHGIEMIPGAIDIFLLLFADVIIFLSSTPVGFHNQLNHVKNEADRLYLSVNFDKTNNMVFSMGGHLAVRERWVYGNKEVKVTNAYTYLGMEFTTKLCINLLLDAYASESKLIQSFVVNGQKGCNGNSKSYEEIEFFRPYDFLGKIFDSQIKPMLSYAAEVLGLENVGQIEKVQTFAMKRFLSVPLQSTNKLLYGESGRYPLFTGNAVKCKKYWIRLIKLPLQKLFRQTYEILLIEHIRRRVHWVKTHTENVVTENDFRLYGCAKDFAVAECVL